MDAIVLSREIPEHMCGFKFHGNDPKHAPCNNHKEPCEMTKKVGSIRLCKKGAACDVCHHCADHCLGHLGVSR